MVIFYSYVSLPEGIPIAAGWLMEKPIKNPTTAGWFRGTPMTMEISTREPAAHEMAEMASSIPIFTLRGKTQFVQKLNSSISIWLEPSYGNLYPWLAWKSTI